MHLSVPGPEQLLSGCQWMVLLGPRPAPPPPTIRLHPLSSLLSDYSFNSSPSVSVPLSVSPPSALGSFL